ncbi:MAG: RNA-protein complex protein Nop10 [Candidatus Altiarchaeum hamiconexum]|uniref:Ribosome biogenesis protein Nop10 n=1 Tax=Candidatus Altarchaeum hamiconexum TaxID=1803513 RepID=A0A8J7YYX1_9ARCH|nr:RNA-protein complex protein Nop10 [Candidatus Altarchaeum hamiconexum]OIQ06042.1 MAG: hypothetical protein AUK59_01430 [Candidatus Altarchaeum sp. CG2_30_32_3053]PIN67386.1 MAG: ribosome biogenesis protein [Candidatus Altarchaeum sp. CG12_big_fil_rev_8_21_14_0_65_33_22]PIV28159.1 MAG: ribosome biogenesis protein [Candidatus Altarchaeum sp. CG03_land_8_20_14_0_80_32_618]PIX48845.1 MAG: ribosome biogenesis protein [Candidatus Altarchaeum sp. CG_4_8_14_3_um_filter_33_2054]PIZ29280.1 MAG: ribos
MKIFKCPSCGRYTMRYVCNMCNVQTAEAKPPKFSPEDKYGKYRRMAKFNTQDNTDEKKQKFDKI